MYTEFMNRQLFKPFLYVLMISVLTLAPNTQASEDHDEARVLSYSGEIKSLNEILLSVKKVISGSVLEVELERKDGKIIYEIEILQKGTVKEVYVDARTGDIISIKDGH